MPCLFFSPYEDENIIDNVKVYSFNFKNDTEEPKRKHYGVIAQELQEIAPELVSSAHIPNGEDTLTVNKFYVLFL